MARRERKPKPLKTNETAESDGSSEWMPHARLKLDNLGAVVSETARLYRLWLSKKMPGDEATKGVFILRELRSGMEAGKIADVQERLAVLTARVEGRRHG